MLLFFDFFADFYSISEVRNISYSNVVIRSHLCAMQTVLLHSCCAPCSAAIIEWLLAAGIRPVLFYFNPNIYPQTEYDIRKAELTRYALSQGVEVIDGDYNHEYWRQHVTGWEHEPERGHRCLQCFKMRLLATACVANERGFGKFATTLASSRWKSLDQIAQAGHWAAAKYIGVEFWEKNWRKDSLSERRNQLLKENGFYNQQYCGCEFSMYH
jgi:predicted adenine nucleotide alpha hydrolase (AANH) superfamily ATPase